MKLEFLELETDVTDFMTEKEFLDSIDCKFSYQNIMVGQKTIELGVGISSNAAFAVLHEICRPLPSLVIEQTRLLDFLDFWSTRFDHSLVSVFLPLANAMIRRKIIPLKVALEAMKAVANYQNQYCALAVVYFSCNDVNSELETLYNQITGRPME